MEKTIESEVKRGKRAEAPAQDSEIPPLEFSKVHPRYAFNWVMKQTGLRDPYDPLERDVRP